MAKMKELSGIVSTIAEETKKAIYNDIDWEIAEYNAEGDEYNAIHSYLMEQVITKMYKDLMHINDVPNQRQIFESNMKMYIDRGLKTLQEKGIL